MRLRSRRLALPVLAAAALLTSAGGASAATLFTTPAHTTRVTVGATASLLSGTYNMTSGTEVVQSCSSSTFNVRVSQNADTSVDLTVTSGAWSGCAVPITPTFPNPWRITVQGNSAVSGSSTVWPTTTLTNFTYDLFGGLYSAGTITRNHLVAEGAGTATTTRPTNAFTDATPPSGSTPPSNGLYWSRPTAAGAPLCLVFARAGSVVGPLIGDGRLHATYCFEGAASTWSMTN